MSAIPSSESKRDWRLRRDRCYPLDCMAPCSFSRAMTISALFLGAWPGFAQTKSDSDQPQSSYTMRLSVDEVVLTFHATDSRDLPINDLKASEVRVVDDGAPPRRIISFESLVDRQIHAAILLDTSESMQQGLAISKLVAEHFAEHIFRQKSDQAMVLDFGYASEFVQPWTDDQATLSRSIQNVRLGRMNPLPGTAILDTVFRACSYGFNKIDSSATGNFILLLSDGEDNAGRTSLDEALRACQRSNTVIYAFLFPSNPDRLSTGPKTLRDLASQTGGRVFPADDAPDTIWTDLKIIEAEIRNQYRLVYNPATLVHNGAFRAIELQLPDRVDKVEVRSGYFAPLR